MKPYADSNFFTRFYLVLPDSSLATNLTDNAREIKASQLPITWLHRAEIMNAFQLHVFGGRQRGHAPVTPEQAAIAQARFRQDLDTSDFLQITDVAQHELLRKAEDLSLRHTARHGFRTYDVLHVASALLLGCDTFWSFDTKASRLAKLESFKTI